MSGFLLIPDPDGAMRIVRRDGGSGETVQRIAPAAALTIASAVVGAHAVMAQVREQRGE